jgi:hypothetical protein
MSSKAFQNVVKLRDMVNIKDFGAKGDGVADDTAAIAAAHATGKPVFYPYGDYKHVGYFPECEGGIFGEGWSTNTGAKRTAIIFYNCTDPQRGAIRPKKSLPKSQWFRLENVMILSSSWDATTGCLGYGLDLGTPVAVDTVYVGNFKRSNVWLYHDAPASASAPYESVFIRLYSAYSGEHGVLVGRGANVLTFINCQMKWNGSPSFGAQPSVSGNYDGFHVSNTEDGNTITSYIPETVCVIGGDASYNSRYGWNFDLVRASSIQPGYAEGNLIKEARIGDISRCHIVFQQLADNENGFLNQQTYNRYFYNNSVFIGGKRVHPPSNFDAIANPALPDYDSGDVVQNAPVKTTYFSRNNDGTKLSFIIGNATPDGTALDLNTETAATFRGFGSGSAVAMGDGVHHLKVSSDFVRLPQLFYQATGQGWNANFIARTTGSAAPTSGTWRHGDIMFDAAPTLGEQVGWICTAAGTPGTWKRWGAIFENPPVDQESVLIGANALENAEAGTFNTAIGLRALRDTTSGTENTAVGRSALRFNVTGNNNTAIGSSAGDNINGGNNTALGYFAMERMTTGSGNVGIGGEALRGGDSVTLSNNSGSNNVAIGPLTGNLITSGSSNIAIGHDVEVDSPTGNNQINIGGVYFHDRFIYTERADPAAPAANQAVVYARDNGSGKTQLCVRFNTGAVQVLSTEP